MLPRVTCGGCFLFILQPEIFSGHHQVYTHVSITHAQRELIMGMRRDPDVTAKKIRIHILTPNLESPFTEGELPHDRACPLDTVVEEVSSMLVAPSHASKNI